MEDTAIGKQDELIVVGPRSSKLQRRRHGNWQASLEGIVLAARTLVLDVQAVEKGSQIGTVAWLMAVSICTAVVMGKLSVVSRLSRAAV